MLSCRTEVSSLPVNRKTRGILWYIGLVGIDNAGFEPVNEPHPFLMVGERRFVSRFHSQFELRQFRLEFQPEGFGLEPPEGIVLNRPRTNSADEQRNEKLGHEDAPAYKCIGPPYAIFIIERGAVQHRGQAVRNPA